MKKKNVLKLIIFFSCSFFLVKGQGHIPDGFFVTTINKKVKEYPYQFNLNTVLNSFLTFQYLIINGKENGIGLTESTAVKSSERIDSTVIRALPVQEKENYLNTTINEIIVYKDSVAYVVSTSNNKRFYIRTFYLENNQWLSSGEDGRRSLEDSRNLIFETAETQIVQVRNINLLLRKVANDTSSFINCVLTQGQNPEEFLLEQVNRYQLVMYGEIHHRKASWDFLQKVIKNKDFAHLAGTIFMELSSDEQRDLDIFFKKDNLDRELLLNVFRNNILVGWNDKGMFDFIISVWKLNKTLTKDKKIRIVPIDVVRPWNSLLTKEDFENYSSKLTDRGRDEFMAKTILTYLQTKKDKRNALFIVGAAHLCKSLPSAGKIISEKLPEKTFAILQHSPIISSGVDFLYNEFVRYGIFDYTFSKNGNRLVAISLKNTPFGEEPFDVLSKSGVGLYQDNFDGYIFLGQLKAEVKTEIIPRLYNNSFIKEVDRRLQLQGTTFKKEFGVKNLTVQEVAKVFSIPPNTKMWNFKSEE